MFVGSMNTGSVDNLACGSSTGLTYLNPLRDSNVECKFVTKAASSSVSLDSTFPVDAFLIVKDS